MSTFLFDLLHRLSQAVLRPETMPAPSDPGGEYVAVRNDFKVERIPAKSDIPGRRHVFADVESFAAFVRKHWTDGNAVEILADTDGIRAVNEAAWFRDEVSANLQKHPDFLGWEKLFNQPLKQRTLIKELVARAHTLRGEEGIVGHFQQLDLANVTDASYTVTEHGNFEVAGQRQTTRMSKKLPGSFFVNVPVYLDRATSEIIVGIVIESVDGEPVFSLRPKNLDVVKLAAYRAEVERLRGLLGDDYLVGAGALRIEA